MKISFHNQFKKDFRKVSKQGKDPRKLENVIELICSEAVLPDNYKDHSLKGSWGEFRELHIQPDWLLIYKKTKDTLFLVRTGSHSDPFE